MVMGDEEQPGQCLLIAPLQVIQRQDQWTIVDQDGVGQGFEESSALPAFGQRLRRGQRRVQ